MSISRPVVPKYYFDHIINIINDRNITPDEKIRRIQLTFASLTEIKSDDIAACLSLQNEEGRTLLGTAVESRQLPVIKMLLAMKADPNTEDKHYRKEPRGDYYITTSLTLAVFYRQVEIVNKLLEAKADPNQRGFLGDPPLVVGAQFHGNKDEIAASLAIMNSLLEKKADPNQRGLHGSLALPAAISNSCDEAVKALLDAKADPNMSNENCGGTPLPKAVSHVIRNIDIVRMLIEAKADPNQPCRIWNSLPLGNVISKNTDHPDIIPVCINMLLEAKANPNLLNQETLETPLMEAVTTGNVSAMKLLLKAKAMLNVAQYYPYDARFYGKPTVSGDTLLTRAVLTNSFDMAKVLIDMKVNVNLPNKETHETPLITAMKKNRPEQNNTRMISLLIEAKADPSLCDRDSRPALHYAIKTESIHSVHVLLKLRAPIPVHCAQPLLDLLSPRNQGCYQVAQCVMRLNCEEVTHLMAEDLRRSFQVYLSKLNTFHMAHRGYVASWIYNATPFSAEISHIIRDYDDRPFATTTPIVFSNVLTINRALNELKSEIRTRTRTSPRLFDRVVQEIDDAIAVDRSFCVMM